MSFENENENMAKPCPICYAPALQDRVIDERFEYLSEDGLIPVLARSVPVEVCGNCGEVLSGPVAAALCHSAICEALGLLTPERIKAIREGFGLSQAQFSKLTGIGEATISRWERGRLLQNRANDRYIRLLSSLPDSMQVLQSFPGSSSVSSTL